MTIEYICITLFSLICRNFTKTSPIHQSLHTAHQPKQQPFLAPPLLLSKVSHYMSSGKIISQINTSSPQITQFLLPSQIKEAFQLLSICTAVSIPHNLMAVPSHGLLVTIKRWAPCGPKQPTSTLMFSLLAISGMLLIIR
jgi:hypothetical protein